MGDKGQFGVATKALIYKNGKYLVLYKSNLEEINPNSFDFPGGRLEFGESPEKAVVREVKEETGLEIKPLNVFHCWTFTKEDFQLVGIDFFCEYISGQEKLSNEHSHFLWVTPKEVSQDSSYPDWLQETINKAEEIRLQLGMK